MFMMFKIKEMHIGFANCVKLHRIKKGITQQTAADYLGISVYKLRDIESARSTCNWKMCLKICEYLEIELFELF